MTLEFLTTEYSIPKSLASRLGCKSISTFNDLNENIKNNFYKKYDLDKNKIDNIYNIIQVYSEDKIIDMDNTFKKGVISTIYTMDMTINDVNNTNIEIKTKSEFSELGIDCNPDLLDEIYDDSTELTI